MGGNVILRIDPHSALGPCLSAGCMHGMNSMLDYVQKQDRAGHKIASSPSEHMHECVFEGGRSKCFLVSCL